MSDDYALNTLLSTFLDDYHDIPSELDVSSLSQSEVDSHVNRIVSSLGQSNWRNRRRSRRILRCNYQRWRVWSSQGSSKV